MDAIAVRGLERLLIVAGAIAFGFLGYRLFLAGLATGPGRLEVEGRFYRFAFSGTGPGLFFMAFGALVLVASLVTGRAERRRTLDLPGPAHGIQMQESDSVTGARGPEGFRDTRVYIEEDEVQEE